jgi:hypothetical protein
MYMRNFTLWMRNMESSSALGLFGFYALQLIGVLALPNPKP